jgi:hypothetical protein
MAATMKDWRDLNAAELAELAEAPGKSEQGEWKGPVVSSVHH